MQAGVPPGELVLLVEDDAGAAALLTELLSGAGFAAVSARDGEDGLALARERRPDVAVLDVKLPGLSGYEVCRALRELYGPSLPVLFLSGERTEPYDRVAGLLIGGDDYVTKPYAPDELLARIRVLLRRTNGDGRAGAPFTARELEVLELLGRGLEQKEIAAELVITAKTVATHIERMLAKTGMHSRAQLVAWAYRERVLSTGD